MVVDRFTKSIRLIPVRYSYSAEDSAIIYLDEIVCRRGLLLSIISDRGEQLTSKFRRLFQICLGTTVKLSSTFNPNWLVKWSVRYKPLKICLRRA